ncbi:MAG: hypothetical protein C4570_04090 [Ammonifex sp.]|nr:MAG: hypothetical protein C4570_04090 [Ammonifex sp.]
MNEGAFRKALVVLIITGILVKIVISFENGISDPDTWWHLAAGKYMITNQAIPHHDIFSWTVAGEPWITHEWLSEVLFYLFYLAGKFYGVLFLILLLSTALMVFYWKLLSRPRDSFFIAALTLLVTGELLAPFIEIRPQVISYLFFMVFLYVLYSFVQDKKDNLFVLPLLTVLWTNSHGSFFLGPVLVILFIVCGFYRPQTGEGRITHYQLKKSETTKLITVLILCLLAVLINPNGSKLLLYPLQTLGDSQMTDNIQEWLSPDFHDLYYQVFLAYYLMTFLTLVITPKRIQLVDLLLYLIFGIAAFLHIRFIAYVLLISGLLWSRYFVIRFSPKLSLSRLKAAAIPVLIALYAIALVKSAPPQTAIDYKFTPKDGFFPVEALTYLKANPLTGKMLNDYGWGGYLIWNRPEEKVFIDGRADVYMKQVFGDYRKITRLKPGADELLDKYKIDYAFLPSDAPLVEALRFSPHWSVLYEDKKAAVLLKKST